MFITVYEDTKQDLRFDILEYDGRVKQDITI